MAASDFLREATDRGFVHQCTDLEALDAAMKAGPVAAYIGFDCTADSLHVGSLLQIMILRLLQKHGHKPVVLMGGGTTRIGDPSGRDESRQMLTDQRIAENMAASKRNIPHFTYVEEVDFTEIVALQAALARHGLKTTFLPFVCKAVCLALKQPQFAYLNANLDEAAGEIAEVDAEETRVRPGDRVVINPRGQVQVNGRWLREPYVSNYCPVDAQGMGPCRPLNAVVPPKHVLTLGDNRANSWDGRFWPGGAFLPDSEIIGRAFWRFWPPGTAGELRTPDPLPPATPQAPARAQG